MGICKKQSRIDNISFEIRIQDLQKSLDVYNTPTQILDFLNIFLQVL